ncbi:MAG TPA: DUF3082 domain-containing protein [Cyanothece sp. UBA12306]|nr:DUF3082 domain-containing protein [Cyanothece sp. UBA12306]
MADSPNTSPSNPEPSKQKVTPLRCLIGSTISGSLAIALYSLTLSIVHSFASKPLTSKKVLVLRIGSLVRTLVMGVASLGTFIFAFVAFGLILLAIQLSFAKKS